MSVKMWRGMVAFIWKGISFLVVESHLFYKVKGLDACYKGVVCCDA